MNTRSIWNKDIEKDLKMTNDEIDILNRKIEELKTLVADMYKLVIPHATGFQYQSFKNRMKKFKIYPFDKTETNS